MYRWKSLGMTKLILNVIVKQTRVESRSRVVRIKAEHENRTGESRRAYVDAAQEIIQEKKCLTKTGQQEAAWKTSKMSAGQYM